MQTSRLLPAIAVIVLCASTFSTRADDTPAQAAAREALMQDLNGGGSMDTQTPPPAAPVPPPVVVPPPPAPVIPTPAPSPSMTMETNMPAAPVAAAPGSSSNIVVPPVEQEVPATNQATQYPINPAPANPPMTPTTMPNSVPTSAASAAPTAPPVPLTDSQQQQLQALLQQYQANQITPAQYQEGRAKILSGQ